MKKLGPEINPTEPMNNTSPMFSNIFRPLEEISIFFPSFVAWDIVDLIWEEKSDPYKRAIIKTPEEPRLTPLILILPSKRPKKMQTNVENIKKGIPLINMKPERMFIFL